MARVAFVGLGRMGHGMAGRYLDSGFTVAVWNRSKSKAEGLIARGARWASSPADAAEGADAIVTMVADDRASRAEWLATDFPPPKPGQWLAHVRLCLTGRRSVLR